MIDRLLVGATLVSFEEILSKKGVPYKVREDEEYKYYKKLWDESAEKEDALKKARPAIERIASKELYLFETSGDPLVIRLNYLTRELERDSFGEILLERPDKDWRFSISIKSDAYVLATLPVADRDEESYKGRIVNVSNEIDDFGDRIFSVPCSNEYFSDVNATLQKIEPFDRETWTKLLSDEDYAYDNLLTPMLAAIGREFPRIFKDHPEAPGKLIDYFYGNIDYYFIHPIEALEVTRIAGINSHGGLGRIPDNTNLIVPAVKLPTQLLDVRFAAGKYGEISRDTLQLSFDGGWTVRFKISIANDPSRGKFFTLMVYLPSTPFGSYRDQVDWEK